MKISNGQKIILLIFSLFLVIRIINLLRLPIFNDEATYIDWGWRMIQEKDTFYSVRHAKPPLFMWLIGLTRYAVSEPLLAGRLLSVIFGSIAFFGLYKLLSSLFSKPFLYYSLILYSLSPIFLFFDRQALMESALTAVYAWSLFYTVLILRNNEYKDYIILGTILGIGYLIKTNAIVFLIESVFLILFPLVKRRKFINSYFVRLSSFITVYLIILSPLLLNNIFWLTFGQNNKYVMGVKDLIMLPVNVWLINIKNYLLIILLYFGPLFLLFAVIGFVALYKKRKAHFYILVFLTVTNMVFSVFLDRLTIPRHLEPYLITLLYPAIYALSLIKSGTLVRYSFLIIVLIQPFFISMLLILKPFGYFDLLDKISPLSQKTDYVTYWSSGYGMDQTISYLRKVSEKSRIIVGVRLDAGIPENAVFAYFQGSKTIIPIYFDILLYPQLKDYDCLKFPLPFYFVSRDLNMGGLENFLEEKIRYYKPEGEHFIGVFSLKSNCGGKTLEIN